jgi:hypothetical protein
MIPNDSWSLLKFISGHNCNDPIKKVKIIVINVNITKDL